jgi:predicted MFS family arabinose efflux permease
MTVIFVVVALSLLSFSLLTPLAGSVSAVVGAGVALVTWSVAGWAITPGHQYRLIELPPGTQNVTLSLNASAIYLGQGAGAGIGALVLLYGSPASLGWVAALYVSVESSESIPKCFAVRSSPRAPLDDTTVATSRVLILADSAVS